MRSNNSISCFLVLGWFNFITPQLNHNIVKSELITLQEASRNLRVNEETIRALLSNNGFGSQVIGRQELISRRELSQTQNQLSAQP